MIAFRDSTDRSHMIGSSEPRFQFIGQELPDASENSGLLFGGPPPRIRVADGGWEDVGTIVLGAEGSGRGRWRMTFEPNPAIAEQDMPPEIARRKAGWYFVRFYDLRDELIDSLDFRFGAGLQGITIQQSDPFPSATGHGAMTIEIQHDADWYVYAHPRVPGHVKIERTAGKTILTIPPVQECDRTHWFLGPTGGPQVEVTMLAERVWWGVSNVNAPPSKWRDTCLSLSPQDFSATSEEAVWLRFPEPRWTDRVFIGFQRGRWREFVPRVGESTITIALRDFSDSQELADRTEDHVLRAWLKVNSDFHEAAVATVAAETLKETLSVALMPACHLASVLTALHRATRGPLRQLLKEVLGNIAGPDVRQQETTSNL